MQSIVSVSHENRKATVNLEGIPAELKERSQWVRWRVEERKGKATKIPYNPRTNYKAQSTNPATWGAFDVAAGKYRDGFDGIGFMFSADDDFFGIDLDACRNPETGELTSWAREIVDSVGTYTEVSPSGYGVKLVARGRLPEGARNVKKLRDVPTFGGKAPEVAIYDKLRYWCITGQHVEGTPRTCEPRQEQLDALLAKLFSAKSKGAETGNCKPSGSLFDRLIADCAAARNGERSERDYAVCAHAVERGMDREQVWQSVANLGKFSEGGREYFERTWQAAMERVPQSQHGGHTIEITTEEHVVIAEAIDALAKDPAIFQRGGQLVDVVNDSLPKRRGIKAIEAPRIVPIPEPRLRTRLSARARFVKMVESENGVMEVAQHPPGWLVKGTAAAGSWPNIRHLEAVVTSPVMRHDGSILQTPGYDHESGILYLPRREFPQIPDMPLADEIGVAVDALSEVVEDFPFERDEHRAGWFAAMLTPIARFAFDGPAPLFLFDANVRGAGKGLAVDAAGIISTGDRLATASYSHDDNEMRKAITSIAMAGDRAVLLDNIGGAFGTPSLDAALTSTKWKDRVLGGNQVVELPLLATWFGTGNNVVLTGDIVRRICHIRLNSPEETPEEREGFRHADLRGWLQGEQPRLLAAALTILRGYVAAGRPDKQLKAWGSFEGWSALVRNAIVWAGLPDPGATRQELAKQSDTEGAQLRALLAGWQEIDTCGNGLTVGEVFERLGECGSNAFPTLRAALNESCTGRKGERPTPRALAYKLRHFRRRVVGGLYFEAAGDVRGSQVWKVEG